MKITKMTGYRLTGTVYREIVEMDDIMEVANISEVVSNMEKTPSVVEVKHRSQVA